MSDFQEFGKIARLNRDVVITEKIDGTNAQILIEEIVLESPAGTPVHEWHSGRGGNVPTGGEVAVVKNEQTFPGTGSLRGDIPGLNPTPAGEPTLITVARAFGVSAGSRNRWLQPGKGDNFGFAGWVKDNAEELVALLGPGRHFGEWWGAGVQRRYAQETKRFSLFNVSRYGEVTKYTDPRCLALNLTDVVRGPLLVTGIPGQGGTGSAGQWLPDVSVWEGPPLLHQTHKGVKVCACREARAALKATVGGVPVEAVPTLYRGPWFAEYTDPLREVMDAAGMLSPDESTLVKTWAPSLVLDALRRQGSAAAPGFMKPEGIVVFHEASGQLFKATLEGDEKPKGQQ